MAKEVKTSQEKPKKSRWLWWTCGGCGCLAIIIVIILFSFGSFAGFGPSSLFGNIWKDQSYQDEEDRQMTKAELIDYFVEETTTYSSPNTPIRVAKWEKPVVTVSIADVPPEGGEKTLNDFISKFNNNSIKIKLQHTEKDGDIKIYFQESTRGAAGLSGPSTGGDYTIDNADVKLAQDVALFEQSISSVLSHELFHALGFTGHYSGTTCRLMSTGTCGSRLTINEERLIQMLYATDLPSNSGEAEIRAYFQNWNPK